MIKLKSLIKEEYRGNHTAPDKRSDAIYDLSNTYPDDIYSYDAPRLYGDSRPDDVVSLAVIRGAKGRPSQQIKIYRAVPKIISSQNSAGDLEKQKRYILKYGKVPPNIKTDLDRSDYYDKISDELDKLNQSPNEQVPEKITINPGDWVTISKEYAREHGESTLMGQYKILSKTVPAKHVFTHGDSIHEWGYDPS